jgi:hypothetical protein
MKLRLTAPLAAFLAAALAAALACAALAAGAAMIGIYRDDMQSTAQRAEMLKVAGEDCARGPLGRSLRVEVGKHTRECAYRTPVIGRKLEIVVTARLLDSTPRSAQRRAFVAVNLRGEEGHAGYQLVVYPLQRKVQLRRVLGKGQVRYLAIEKGVSAVQGLEKPNRLRLRALDDGHGGCRLLAFIGRTRVAEASEEAGTALPSRLSGFSTGAAARARGIAASFGGVVVRVPDPFAE